MKKKNQVRFRAGARTFPVCFCVGVPCLLAPQSIDCLILLREKHSTDTVRCILCGTKRPAISILVEPDGLRGAATVVHLMSRRKVYALDSRCIAICVRCHSNLL